MDKKLLLVEDEPMTCMIERKILSDLGYTVDTAASGEEALEKLTEEHAGGIIDMGLPGISGIELTKKIREKGGVFTKIPLVALSANPELDYKIQMIEAGGDDYLVKPIQPDSIREILNTLIP